jgi:hypothetical protein
MKGSERSAWSIVIFLIIFSTFLVWRIDYLFNQREELRATTATGACGDKLTVIVGKNTVFAAGQKFEPMIGGGIYEIPAADGGIDVRMKFWNGQDKFVLHRWPSQGQYKKSHDLSVPPTLVVK